MKTFQVKTGTSVDGITFGTSREKVREHFGEEYREMKKSKFSKNTMDAYSFCHIFYTGENTLEAVEIFPESQVLIDGQQLPDEYDAAVKWLQSIVSDVLLDEDGATSTKLGISLYAPNRKIESILVADSQYFAEA